MHEFHSLDEYPIIDILSCSCVTFAQGILKLNVSLMSSSGICLVMPRLNNYIIYILVMASRIFMTKPDLGCLSFNSELSTCY